MKGFSGQRNGYQHLPLPTSVARSQVWQGVEYVYIGYILRYGVGGLMSHEETENDLKLRGESAGEVRAGYGLKAMVFPFPLN